MRPRRSTHGKRHIGRVSNLVSVMSYKRMRGRTSSINPITANALKKTVMRAVYDAMRVKAPVSGRQNSGSLRNCGQFKVIYKLSRDGRSVRVTLIDNPAALRYPGDSTWRYVDKGTRPYTIKRQALFFYVNNGTAQMAYYKWIGKAPSGTTRKAGRSKGSIREWYVLEPPKAPAWKLRSLRHPVRVSLGTTVGKKRNGRTALIQFRTKPKGAIPIGRSRGRHFMSSVFDTATARIRNATKSRTLNVHMIRADDYWDNKVRVFSTGKSTVTRAQLGRTSTSAKMIPAKAANVSPKSNVSSLRSMMKSSGKRGSSVTNGDAIDYNKWGRVVERGNDTDAPL